MSIIWETGLGSCIVLMLGCIAATLSIVSERKSPRLQPRARTTDWKINV